MINIQRNIYASLIINNKKVQFLSFHVEHCLACLPFLKLKRKRESLCSSTKRNNSSIVSVKLSRIFCSLLVLVHVSQFDVK